MAERSLQLSRAGIIKEELGLVQEVQETFRRLLQHILFIAMLALRLYSLPLMYLCYKLSRPEEIWPPSTWSFVMRSPSRFLTHTHFRNPNSQSFLYGSFGLFWAAITRPFRVVGTLYCLGKLIDQNPKILERQSPPRPEFDDFGIEMRGIRKAAIEDLDERPLDESVQAPASASQVYHAALLNGNTLDNILAAFEAADSSATSGSERRDSSPLAGTGFKGDRYRNSSIQTTPERLMTPPKIPPTLGDDPKIMFSVLDPKKSSAPVLVLASPSENLVHAEPKTLPASVPENVSPCCSEINILDVSLGQENKEATPGLKRCPTFARRHATSRLPQRSTSADKIHRYGASMDSQTMIPKASSVSPVRRGKLQRRVKVYQD